MSLIKEPIITDRTGKKIASYLSIIAGTKASPGDLTYEEISRIVRSGGGSGCIYHR
jgi:hypothetical protein